jgi:hypothetical protein
MTDKHAWVGPTKANEGWSEWIEWSGGDMPLDGGADVKVKRQDLKKLNGFASQFYWGLPSGDSSIIAYRYRLDDNQMTPEEEEMPAEEWDGYVDADDDTIPTSIKQLRYQDAKGEDWIDEFARTASVDEFRGAMKFTIGKYNRRAGKKDELIKEIEKMRDYCDRWIDYERTL